MKITVAQVRVVAAKGELDRNHAILMDVLAEVAPHKPDVVVTPECYLDGYAAAYKDVTREELARYAIDPRTSPYTRAVSEWARAYACWVVFGCTRVEAGELFNTACIFDRQGTLIACYDKLHCQLHDLKFTPGHSLPVYASDFGTFGVMICADRRWPETVRTLALKGARVIFNPTWGMNGDLNLAIMRARSFESEIAIVFTHPRQSLVTGPEGEVLLDERDEGTRFSVTEIDLSLVDRVRAEGPYQHLTEWRTDAYFC